MIRITFLFLFSILSLTQTAFAQSDSLTLVKAKWGTKRVGPGMKWKHYWFKDKNLFGANQNINILEIRPRRKIKLDLGYEPKQLKITSTFGKENNALAALNGTFFDIKMADPLILFKQMGRL